jgi:hypothetical protein
MKQARAFALLAVVAVLSSGCATTSTKLATTYVSPAVYVSYDCTQLIAEAGRIRNRVVELGGKLDDSAKNDKILAGVGLLVFWPSLLFLGGNAEQEHEFSRLKGEGEAVNQSLIAKKCGT